MTLRPGIRIQNATENNLQGISLAIPHNQLIVVTGVSGSGKSSLAFDVMAREGQRRHLETLSGFARQFAGKLTQPKVDSIEGLAPVIAVGQKTSGAHPRSTVGTLSGIYDHLRLLFARIGASNTGIELSRSSFSFNSAQGACPTCNGLGLEEKISLHKLLADPNKTLREGALAPTLPSGYIMYSQVTVEVLNRVCEAHGFNVDIPWNQLSADQQNVILNGSNLLKVPFGKHSLESRLKWTGITAKPREEGFYKGMLPIMSDILRRDRNKNILKYAESLPCNDCGGSRINKAARSVKINGRSIVELAAMELVDLAQWLKTQRWPATQHAIAQPISDKILGQIQLLTQLGIDYLSCDRAANSLSGGETQRIRLVNQVTAELSNVLYIFDEPSIGLHAADNSKMMRLLRMLVHQGNTVIVVEHDAATIKQADWIVDIGPKAGMEGGKLLYNGPATEFHTAKNSITQRLLNAAHAPAITGAMEFDELHLQGCTKHNLHGLNVIFKKRAFNVVCGVSGAGKSSLVHGCLQAAIARHLGKDEMHVPIAGINGHDGINKLVNISQAPIGRTPRSNPATYTGLADKLRDLFASQPDAKAVGFKKGRFSFNNKGGRCETCEGAGRIQLGMHFLGRVDVLCGTCGGKRFNEETLKVHYGGKSIADVLEMRVSEALTFFSDQPSLLRYLNALDSVGLGYITLGQSSTTLSGGEAQRVRLAAELQQPSTGNTLYILDEPTVGLHMADVEVLVSALRKLVAAGNTVVCIEHDLQLVRQADWLIDLGPGSGQNGGKLVAMGTPEQVRKIEQSKTGAALSGAFETIESVSSTAIAEHIRLNGVTTNQLNSISVSIPKNRLTVVTGVSGSGKSSLAFDTLYAEAQGRFSESLSPYVRSLLHQSNTAEMESCSGLGPAIAINRKSHSASRRSTVGTLTGLYDHYRVLFSRIAQLNGREFSAQHFSFNHQLGACPACNGLGVVIRCDPNRIVNDAHQTVLTGAIGGNKTIDFYSDPLGRHLAILKKAADTHNVNLDVPWIELSAATKKFVLYGTGVEEYDVVWNFQTKTRSGTQEVTAPWLGFCNYIDDEYQRRLHNKNIQPLLDLMHDTACTACNGTRLKPALLDVRLEGKNIAELSLLPIKAQHAVFTGLVSADLPAEAALIATAKPRVVALLETLVGLGLGHLNGLRTSASLSGGESQRLRLAGQLSAKLYGVTYVLDEPTIGLHDSDTKALLIALRSIVNNGNTVVVVEHDEQVIRAADHIIELGPGAGTEGGNIVCSGTLQDVLRNPESPTGIALSKPTRSKPTAHNVVHEAFGVRGATANNLKSIDINFISGGLIAVTGVSGSGKSTLVHDVLAQSAERRQPIGCDAVVGLENFTRVLSMDQAPIAGYALSTPATITGLLDQIRTSFAATSIAKAGALKKSAFSYIHKDGKCAECNGYGQIKTSMDFLSDVWTLCESCKGGRYRAEVLMATLNDLNIAEVLQLTARQVRNKFADQPKWLPYLDAMLATGIGHLQLGQPGNTLSGGEAQRLKLAAELTSSNSGPNLYLFDEPSTGLHLQDIEVLLNLFHSLVQKGHTVLYIEHHAHLIAAANQVIELGPGAGPDGGCVIQY